MSGWTTLTLRGRYSKDYDYSEYDEHDRYQATCDLIVTLQNHQYIKQVGHWKGHVYAYLNTGRYDWDTAEAILDALSEIIDDAVVIGANDTTDTGTARYYPVKGSFQSAPDDWTDCYKETQSEDGTMVGAIAAAIMTARHGIVAQERLAYRATGENWDSGVYDDHEERGRDMTEIL